VAEGDQKYRLSAWLSVAYLGLIPVSIGAQLYDAMFHGPYSGWAMAMSLWIDAIIFIWIFLFFRGVLNEFYGYSDADGIIRIIIMLTVLVAAAAHIESLGREDFEFIASVSLLGILALGGAYIYLGIRLSELPEPGNEVFENIKIFAYVQGWGLVTLIGIPVALVGAVIFHVLLARIFFSASRSELGRGTGF